MRRTAASIRIRFISSDSFFDVVVVAGGGGAGDHFAEEAGEEEHGAQDHREEGEVEEGLVGDGAEADALRLVDQLGGDDSPLAEAILDRIKHDAYKINIAPVDPTNYRSMREVYGLDPALSE